MSKRKYSKPVPGQKYGKLTFLERVENKRPMGKFQCDCGIIKTMRLDYVFTFDEPSCGCGRRKIPKTGEKFNRLTFIGFVRMGIPRADGRLSAIGTFKCDCGVTKDYPITNITSGLIKGCGCLRRLAKGEAGKNRVLRMYKFAAKKRGHEFLLSKDEFTTITSKNCFYCGNPPSNSMDVNGHNNRANSTGRFVYNGIDRKDNAKCYTSDNCVPCCRWCNRSKTTDSPENFIKHCKRVVEFQTRQKSD